jgi:tyrosine-protein kinase Etk/Wzc
MSDVEILESEEKETINLLDYLLVIAKHRRMIFWVTVTAFVLSVIVSLLLPKIFSSTARIIPPPQDQGMMAAMLGQVGGLAGLAGGMLGGGTTGDLYVGMLRSEAVKDVIIDKFKLMDVYKKDYRIDTYEALDDRASIELGKKDGIISITVEDKDPKRAADMANAYVDELEKLSVTLNITGAGQNRKFLEQRLIKAKLDLERAEDNLKAYQAKNKALDITEQAKVTIGGVAQLRAQLAIQEVQLASLRSYLTDENDEIKTVKASIANLKGQIASLEGSGKGSSIPNVGSVPALGQEYLRLMRELKIQETIVEFLTKQYEMAKLSESKNVSGVQVLQSARIADKKTKPKRALIVLGITFMTFIFAVLLAFLLEYRDQMGDEEREKWNSLRRYLPVMKKSGVG